MPEDPKFTATRAAEEFVRRYSNKVEFRAALVALGVTTADANNAINKLVGGTWSQGEALANLGFGG